MYIALFLILYQAFDLSF